MSLKNLLRNLDLYQLPFKSFVLLLCLISIGTNATVFLIQPSQNSYEEIQEALIIAQPGDVVRLTAGRFYLADSLSLDVDGVTLEGEGRDVTILDFSNQLSGAQGLSVTSNDVRLLDFGVENAKGDAIKAKGSNNIHFVRVRTEWTNGPDSKNGAYGLYPVESENVLIDDCVAIGASDAGIYVGQSKNIIVRNSLAKHNVAGIEIENSYYADVHDNLAIENTGGILVFDLPDLPQQGGHHVRVFQNRVVNNNTPNFAPEGNIVGEVPSGTGIMIMANSFVEIFANTIENNGTTGLAIVSYADEYEDANYYPHPKSIQIHDNSYINNGRNPDIRSNELARILFNLSDQNMADIFWDGMLPLPQMVFGQPENEKIIINEAPETSLIVLDPIKYLLPFFNPINTDHSKFRGTLKSLEAVEIDAVL